MAASGSVCDTDRIERVLAEHAPMVKYIAQRLAFRLPPSVTVDDLIQAGVIGLIDAIDKYDPRRDTSFKTYAEFRIRGAMLDALRNLDWAPRSVRQKEHTLTRAYEELERHLGRPARDEEVAAYLELDVDELHDWLNQLKGTTLVSLESPGLRTPDGEALNLLDMLSSDRGDDPAELIQASNLKALVAQAIDELPQQEKVVIALYYYEELTMKEIGRVLEITESRVSQVHSKAILRLRAKLRALVAEA
jgi:RNA polymerase sigma factor for flagellar operon FliA